MGMSSSQARLLAITSRISDIEYKSQAISNNKIRLADESEQVANNYNTALNKQKYTFSTYNNQGQAVKYSLNSTNLAACGLTLKRRSNALSANLRQYSSTATTSSSSSSSSSSSANGRRIIPERVSREDMEIQEFDNMSMRNLENQATFGYINGGVPTSFTETELYDMIESGEFYLVDASGQEVNSSNNVALCLESDSTNLAKAEAEYNAETAKIQKKEKILENDLKELDTEHSALTTEQDSIKSLIGDNVEKSFSLFS